jgi:mRNA-degrading endonuclease toxin of MazEF toxin-antitoxin module
MSLAESLKAAGVSSFNGLPGDVYVVDDADVVIPEAKKNRVYHGAGRTCIILSNDAICGNPAYPIVTIAPTSSRTDLKDVPDFLVTHTSGNGLDVTSLIMLGHVQPVRKTSLIKRIGTLSLGEWEDMLAHLLWSFDRA